MYAQVRERGGGIYLAYSFPVTMGVDGGREWGGEVRLRAGGAITTNSFDVVHIDTVKTKIEGTTFEGDSKAAT